jgi:enamine deaminase RidA (YjgF/YER057c/UK114 family)
MIKRFKVGSRMSQAVVANGFVFIAGQVADTRQGSLAEQAKEVLAKIEALLAEAGTDKAHLVAVDVFLPAIADFDALNVVYDAWVDKANPPARACVEARLADPNLCVEMTAVAVLPQA